MQKAISLKWHWKANPVLCFFFILRWKDHWDQWLMIDHCCYLLWLTSRMWGLHLHDSNTPDYGAVWGIGCKGIVLWDDVVGLCVFSSCLREQILHLLIQLEYKWPFLLLMYKPEQIPGCSPTVLEQFLSVATCSPMCSCLLLGQESSLQYTWCWTSQVTLASF